MLKRNLMKLTAMTTGMILMAGCTQSQTEQAQETEAVTMEQSKQMELNVTDPEFMAIEEHFINEQVSKDAAVLDETQQQLVAVVSLVVQQSDTMLFRQTAKALDAGLTPVQVREAVYQCAPYVGFPKTEEALAVVNQVFTEKGISLPLEEQGTVSENTRLEAGLNAHAQIFGESMRQAAAAGFENMPRSSQYLSTNCFGDYYTRTGLDLETREMLTLAILTNLGTESQITSHIRGNANLGRSREFISDVIYQCLPYAGYPRILNALNCLNQAIPEELAE